MPAVDTYNYKATPTVGQNDNMSCWAACLSWWLKAVADGRPAWSQNKVIAEFDKYTSDDGGFDPQNLIDVFSKDARLKISAGVFKTDQYRFRGLPLGDKPVIIAFNHADLGGTHMNVLFGQVNRDLFAMEPYYPYPGRDGQRTGQFVERNADFYIKASPNVILCWPTVVMKDK
ncbi:MAG: hypothetical protein JO055_02930 [Alphaproteobacteria bacterium]|nr:hypothetical protein [Alphaproteobacteria bacterium]